MKKFTAVLMVLILVIGCLGACNSSGNDNKPTEGETTASSSKAASSKSSSKESEASENKLLTGPGNNNDIALDLTLFDKKYTLGKSKVKDLVDNDWGYDSNSWADVNMEEEIEYKEYSKEKRSMDKDTTELFLKYTNFAETFAVPADCIITYLEFSGSPDGAINKAGVKIFDGEVDLAQCTNISELEEALCKVVGSMHRDTISKGYKYHFGNFDGTLDLNVDTTGDTIEKYGITMSLGKNFTYEPD